MLALTVLSASMCAVRQAVHCINLNAFAGLNSETDDFRIFSKRTESDQRYIRT